jgi:uncharacterized protein YhdP
MKQNHKDKISDDTILNYYKNNKTLHESASELSMTVVSLWRRAKKLNIKWSDKKRPAHNKITLQDILDGKKPEYQTFKLKNRLISERIKENKCEVCGIFEWNNRPLIMQLDHIDGNSHNHLLENLRLICPNCHAQSETYCGKNK